MGPGRAGLESREVFIAAGDTRAGTLGVPGPWKTEAPACEKGLELRKDFPVDMREEVHQIYPPGLWEKLLPQKMHPLHLSPRAGVTPEPGVPFPA